jgi:hypothetical protein
MGKEMTGRAWRKVISESVISVGKLTADLLITFRHPARFLHHCNNPLASRSLPGQLGFAGEPLAEIRGICRGTL